MYIYIYIYIYVCIYVHIHIYIYMHTYTYKLSTIVRFHTYINPNACFIISSTDKLSRVYTSSGQCLSG